MVFTMNLMIVHGILLCNSFLISLCMFIVWKALLISSATVIVRAGVAIWLNLFAGVLFNVCSVVTVECCVAITTTLMCRATINCLGEFRQATESL